jgi:hypothetical protein
MGFWKLGFLGILCGAFSFSIDAVELRRNQPTERISGSYFFSAFIFSFVDLVSLI